MNGKNIFDMTEYLDDEYINASAPGSRRPGIKAKRKLSAGFIAAVIAVFSVSAVTAGAVYTTFFHRESIDRIMDEGQADKLESLGTVSGDYTENGHIRITLENVASDGRSISALLTTEPLDELGREYLDSTKGWYQTDLYYTDTGEIAVRDTSMAGPSGYVSGEPFTLKFSFLASQDDFSRGLELRFRKLVTGYDGYTRAVETEEDNEALNGLHLALDPKQNVRTVSFFSEEGMELTLAPLIMSIEHQHTEEPWWFLTIHMKDGSEDGFTEETLRNNKRPLLRDAEVIIVDENRCIETWNLRRVIDIDQVDYITVHSPYGDIDYKRR
ncbi:MAG: DUF4179 domain-containing protein [Ruminococcus sp.]|nr:DUF4179 domain-containing protein [Ruminococcus sp.]